MIELHMDEHIFWTRMTPARLYALLDAHFRPAGSGSAAKQEKSLSEFFMGG